MNPMDPLGPPRDARQTGAFARRKPQAGFTGTPMAGGPAATGGMLGALASILGLLGAKRRFAPPQAAQPILTAKGPAVARAPMTAPVAAPRAPMKAIRCGAGG